MKRTEQSEKSRSIRRAIISVWHKLDEPSLGADELSEIQERLAELFDESEAESPARIAAELAKEGAELRHPDVIEYDARWRRSRIESRMKAFERLMFVRSPQPLTLGDAATAISELEGMRVRYAGSDDDINIRNVKEVAIEARENAIKNARDDSLPRAIREVQVEIAEWLRVWLETPHLFAEWLELRQTSSEFQTKFVMDQSA